MQYRQLGASGLTVSVVGLGCNNFGGVPVVRPNGAVYGSLDLEKTRAVVDAAFDAGVNFFDTADLYGKGDSERFLGEILKDRRHEVVIGTKWGSGMGDRHDIAWGSRRYIRQAVDASLARLGTDYIDLYQMHWPDPRTPLSETIAALDELVRDGKIRYFGHSHFNGWQVAHADWTAKDSGHERFISAQNHYNLMERAAEIDLIPSCEHFGVGLLPYFPLAHGMLTGKYRRGEPPPEGARLTGGKIDDRVYDRLEALQAFAEQCGRSLLDLAIGGLASRPVVSSVITGATRPEQIKANAAAGDWRLSSAEVEALNVALI